jgi:dihydroorotate dehydrogenase
MYKILRPFLFSGDAERVHERMIALGSTLANTNLAHFLSALYRFDALTLKTSLWGLDFKNPMGLAAGFDKNGRLVDFLPALGFGFLEVGTVTPVGQPGNDRPRLFRLVPDLAIINRMGFNNEGAAALAERLKTRHAHIPVGVNIGKNKATPNEEAVADYEKCFDELADFADYMVVNVSSPNTPNLRALQDKDSLRALLTRVSELNHARSQKIPLLLKIAPDLTDGALEDIAAIAKEVGLDGIIATNTTSGRDGLAVPSDEVERLGAGGLSGAPVRARSTEVIAFLFERLGKEIPIIGVGGVFSAEDAYEKIRAGAALIQIWTGLIYEGPGLVKKINKGLANLLRRDGFGNIQEAVGVNASKKE